jgi:hypothetical protein
VAQGVDLLQQLDALPTAASADDDWIERAVRAFREPGGEAAAVPAVAPPPDERAPRTRPPRGEAAAFCPQCGTSARSGDRFCHKCGTALAAG